MRIWTLAACGFLAACATVEPASLITSPVSADERGGCRSTLDYYTGEGIIVGIPTDRRVVVGEAQWQKLSNQDRAAALRIVLCAVGGTRQALLSPTAAIEAYGAGNGKRLAVLTRTGFKRD